jgi:hypothetical protein
MFKNNSCDLVKKGRRIECINPGSKSVDFI